VPVRFEEYERSAEDVDWRPTPGSNAERLLRFLLEHPETGFTPSELAEETGIPTGSVGPTLQRLHDRELVRHREPYWAIADDDRVAAYEGMLRGMAALPEDDAWAEIDSAEHTVDEDDLAEWREERGGGE
jgi:hypothetical protein